MPTGALCHHMTVSKSDGRAILAVTGEALA